MQKIEKFSAKISSTSDNIQP